MNQMDSDVSVHLDGQDPLVQMWMIVQQRIRVSMVDHVLMDLDLTPVTASPYITDQDAS